MDAEIADIVRHIGQTRKGPPDVGPKLLDGLRAIDAMKRDGGWPFADVRLEAMGYAPKVAADILSRLDRKGLTECGVSERTGWLTPEGRRVLDAHT